MTVAKKAATTVAKKKAAPKADQFVFLPKKDTYNDPVSYKDEEAVMKAIREGDLDPTTGKLHQVGAEVQLKVEFKPVHAFEKAISIAK